MGDDLAIIVPIALTAVCALVSVVVWVHSRFESTSREARDYTDESVREAREHTKDVYARREEVSRLEARFVGVEEQLRAMRDELRNYFRRDPAE